MRLIRLIFLFASLLAAGTVTAKTIFYQPQVRDRTIHDKVWSDIFRQTRAMGFNTLAIQWTRHGDAFSKGNERDWLTARMHDARKAGLKLIIGLHADPVVHAHLQQPSKVRKYYLDKLAQQNRELAMHWIKTLGAAKIQGWYLPLEIDDTHWRDPVARNQLQAYVEREAKSLGQLLPQPIYISTYFSGKMAPARYAEMLKQLREKKSVEVWVQDGAGVGTLNTAERKLYLNAVHECSQPAAQGEIFELFRQTAKTAHFKAKALPTAQSHIALKQLARCNGESVFFSLRYLPFQGRPFPH